METKEDLSKLFSCFKIRGLTVKKTATHPLCEKVHDQFSKPIRELLGQKFHFKYDLTECTAILASTLKENNIKLLVLIFHLLVLLDDHLDRNPQENHKWIKYFKDGKATGDGTFEKLFNYVMEMRKVLVPNEKYWAKTVGEIAEAYKLYPQLESYKNGHAQLPDAEFLDIRVTESVMQVYLTMYENDSGLDVNEELIANIDWINFNKYACYHVLIINDLFSLMKEVRDGQARFNYVYIKLKKNNLTVEESVDQIVSEVNKYEKIMLDSGQNLRALNNECLTDYVDQVIQGVYGNAYWSSICKRYKVEHDYFDANNNF